MEGLPNLPGNTFCDPTKANYHRSQSLGFKNGYSIPIRPTVGIGGVPIPHNQLNEQELDELANFKPTLTYGQAKQAPPEDYIPAHVAWDKKVLKFNAFFKQTVHESPNEHFRVRPVNIYYYLEDDSISVVEPHVENIGMPQGKLIKRQRLPKNDVGDHWHWKDLNNGVNATFYGKIFHIYDCDEWTYGFLESEGIVLQPQEQLPTDPYIETRREASAPRNYKTKSDFDKLRQFLEMDRKVLRFYAVWDDRDSMFGEMRKFVIHYFLVDDTLEIREMYTPNCGRDPFPILICRQKVPINRYKVESTFPSVVMELTPQEIKEYFTPRDLKIGETVTLYNRRFLIFDCDDFTKAFCWKNFGQTDFTSIDLDAHFSKSTPKMEIPPYNGYGSMEDSMQSCLSLVPQPPKKDFIKMLENDGKVLRFEAIMDSTRTEDKNRRFIISYRLSDDMITIYEPQVRNSGTIGGKFLERTRVAKPGGSPEQPQFYGPQDFYIGAVVEVFSHRFIIKNADEFVLKYMEEHSHQFPASTIQSLRDQIVTKAPTQTGMASQRAKPRTSQELADEVALVKSHLKRIAITSNNRKDKVFLGIDMDRVGYITKENLREMCHKQNLPCDDHIIDALACEINPQNPDCISLENVRVFLEGA